MDLRIDSNPYYEKTVRKTLNFAVTPEDIEQFIIEHNSHYSENYLSGCAKLFSSKLIQTSFNQGHNHFKLPLIKDHDGQTENALYYYIQGEKDNRINLIIKGEMHFSACCYLKYANITFKEDTEGFCGSNCIDSKIIFKGDPGLDSASKLTDCEVYFLNKDYTSCGVDTTNTQFYSPYRDHLIETAKRNLFYRGNLFYLLDKHDKPHKVTFN